MSLAQLKHLSMLHKVPNARANKYALGQGRKRRHRRKGRGILDLLKKGHSLVRQHGLLSKGLNLIPHPYAKKASEVAKVLGYGRRRKGGRYSAAVKRSFAVRGGRLSYMHMAAGRRRRHGRGIFSSIGNFFTRTLPSAAKTVGNFVKDQKLISRGLSLIPHPKAQIGSKVASAIGLGRRRRHMRHRGRGDAAKLKSFGSILGLGRKMRGGCAIGRCPSQDIYGIFQRPRNLKLGMPLGAGRRRKHGGRTAVPRVPRGTRPIYSGGRKHGGAFVRPLPGFVGGGNKMKGGAAPKSYTHNPSSRGHFLGQYLMGAGPMAGEQLSRVRFS